MAEPLFQSRVDWTTWAAHADPRICEGCGHEFKPNHPRRRFCQRTACPGRRPAQPRRRSDRPSGRAQAAARARGVQGFLGDVLIATHRSDAPDGTLEAVITAAGNLVAVERAGASAEVRHQAIVRLCAAGAVRGAHLVPPVPEADT